MECYSFSPWYKMRFHELEALIFFKMEEMDMHCETLSEIQNHVNSGGEYYGYFYSVDEIAEKISNRCK